MLTKEQLALTFCGGVETVTGANFLLETAAPAPEKILIDCGLIQGCKICEDANFNPFPYPAAAIDCLFVTHAHIDHIGRIPKLVRDGFRGPIYSTPPTKAIAQINLLDSLGVFAKEASRDGQSLLYSKEDVAQALSQWQTLSYHQELDLHGLKFELLDAGHIIGSAMILVNYRGKKILFTGDLGNSPTDLLADTEPVYDADYLVMESVYGDRNHEKANNRRDLLEDVVENTMRRGGVLLVPTFSIERTQEILFGIENLMEQSRIPVVPVYLDSPFAIQVTEIYKNYLDYLKPSVRTFSRAGDGLFRFPQLHLSLTTEASKQIDLSDARKVIIAGSGMSNGGRIVHHEKRFLPDPRTTLLLVGYQAAGSLGRRLQDGVKSVTILGETVPVAASIVTISGFSAHKDSDGLLEFVDQSGDTLRKVFVTMGEPRASLFLVQRIRDYLGLDACTPKLGERVILDFN